MYYKLFFVLLQAVATLVKGFFLLDFFKFWTKAITKLSFWGLKLLLRVFKSMLVEAGKKIM